MSEPDEVSVLVAGGGSVGLSTALFLAHAGVRPLVVERREGPSVHPRATGVGPRTLEFFREVGLADALDAAAIDMEGRNLGKLYAETLAQADLSGAHTAPLPGSSHAGGPGPFAGLSPCRLRGTLSQDRLDAVLLAEAAARGVRVAYGTRLVSFEQDGDGVTATLAGPDGERTVRAAYLVAADGARSGVRQALGIGLSGPGALGGRAVSTLFRADLSEYTKGAWFTNCDIANPRVRGLLVTVDGVRDWILHTACGPLHGATVDDFTPERCTELVRAAVGDETLDVEVRSVLPWRPRGQLADRFAAGRVFLVGDAAHAVPPVGAFGLNTGAADAHNLAWKIAAVLHGTAGPGLLDTYESERRPVAAWTLDQAMRRLADPELHWASGPAADAARAAAGVADAPVVHLGYRYDSAAVVGPEPERPSDHDVRRALDAAPGSRLPHLWLERDGARLSTLDLVRSRFTLLTGARGEAWTRAAGEASGRLGIDLAAHRIAPDSGLSDPSGHWPRAAGIAEDGALLVRPDAFVCWRGPAAAEPPAATLTAALTRVLARG